MKKNIDKFKIPTYIINLRSRTDRLEHILREFKDKEEFETMVIEAVKEKNGALGLWKSIKKIIKLAQYKDEDVIIICEDDHIFTADYSYETLISVIFRAHDLRTKLLTGGTSGGFTNIFFATEDLLWIDRFWGTQFIIVFKNFFQEILDAEFLETDTADDKLSLLTSNKLLMFPMISKQKEIGNSDISLRIEYNYNVEELFSRADARLKHLAKKNNELKK